MSYGLTYDISRYEGEGHLLFAISDMKIEPEAPVSKRTDPLAWRTTRRRAESVTAVYTHQLKRQTPHVPCSHQSLVMIRLLQFGYTFIFLVLLAGGVSTTSAQVTELTSQDLLDLVGRNQTAQVFETPQALDPSQNAALQDVIDATGTAQEYDLRSFGYNLVGQGLIRYRTTAQAQSLGWPGANDPYLSQADYAFALILEASGGQGGGTIYSYHDIVESGSEAGDNSYGGASLFGGFQSTFTYDPPLLQYKTPLVFSPTPTTWSDQATTTFGGTISVSGTVEGYGTVRTPAGDYEVMRIRRESGGTTDYEFISPNVGFTVAAVEGQGDGTYLVTVTASSDRFVEQAVAAGQTGAILSDGRASVAFSTGSTAAGQLGLATYNRRPYNESFVDQAAPSDDGTSIRPDVLWDDQYYSILNLDSGLTGFEATVCIDYSTVSGVQQAAKLVLLSRASAAEAWQARATTITGSQLCTEGLTSFSQFAVGSEAQYNPLPVELSAFDAQMEEGGIRVVWQTLSETNNAGFYVERRVRGAFEERRRPRTSTAHGTTAKGWTALGFVEGAGTSQANQDYRFIDTALPFAAHSLVYRLRQVDVDGTESVSENVVVQLKPPATAILHELSPNPANEFARVRYSLPDGDPQGGVEIGVYNVLGRRMMTLVDGRVGGNYGERYLNTSRFPSGVYFVRMVAGGQVQTRRLTVVR